MTKRFDEEIGDALERLDAAVREVDETVVSGQHRYMKLKVREVAGEAGICATCRSGLVSRAINNDLTIICTVSASPIRMRRPIVQCSDYEDRRQESEYEMRKIAWTISTDRKGEVGFRPPKKDDDR